MQTERSRDNPLVVGDSDGPAGEEQRLSDDDNSKSQVKSVSADDAEQEDVVGSSNEITPVSSPQMKSEQIVDSESQSSASAAIGNGSVLFSQVSSDYISRLSQALLSPPHRFPYPMSFPLPRPLSHLATPQHNRPSSAFMSPPRRRPLLCGQYSSPGLSFHHRSAPTIPAHCVETASQLHQYSSTLPSGHFSRSLEFGGAHSVRHAPASSLNELQNLPRLHSMHPTPNGGAPVVNSFPQRPPPPPPPGLNIPHPRTGNQLLGPHNVHPTPNGGAPVVNGFPRRPPPPPGLNIPHSHTGDQGPHSKSTTPCVPAATVSQVSVQQPTPPAPPGTDGFQAPHPPPPSQGLGITTDSISHDRNPPVTAVGHPYQTRRPQGRGMSRRKDPPCQHAKPLLRYEGPPQQHDSSTIPPSLSWPLPPPPPPSFHRGRRGKPPPPPPPHPSLMMHYTARHKTSPLVSALLPNPSSCVHNHQTSGLHFPPPIHNRRGTDNNNNNKKRKPVPTYEECGIPEEVLVRLYCVMMASRGVDLELNLLCGPFYRDILKCLSVCARESEVLSPCIFSNYSCFTVYGEPGRYMVKLNPVAKETCGKEPHVDSGHTPTTSTTGGGEGESTDGDKQRATVSPNLEDEQIQAVAGVDKKLPSEKSVASTNTESDIHVPLSQLESPKTDVPEAREKYIVKEPITRERRADSCDTPTTSTGDGEGQTTDGDKQRSTVPPSQAVDGVDQKLTAEKSVAPSNTQRETIDIHLSQLESPKAKPGPEWSNFETNLPEVPEKSVAKEGEQFVDSSDTPTTSTEDGKGQTLDVDKQRATVSPSLEQEWSQTVDGVDQKPPAEESAASTNRERETAESPKAKAGPEQSKLERDLPEVPEKSVASSSHTGIESKTATMPPSQLESPKAKAGPEWSQLESDLPEIHKKSGASTPWTDTESEAADMLMSQLEAKASAEWRELESDLPEEKMKGEVEEMGGKLESEAIESQLSQSIREAPVPSSVASTGFSKESWDKEEEEVENARPPVSMAVTLGPDNPTLSATSCGEEVEVESVTSVSMMSEVPLSAGSCVKEDQEDSLQLPPVTEERCIPEKETALSVTGFDEDCWIESGQSVAASQSGPGQEVQKSTTVYDEDCWEENTVPECVTLEPVPFRPIRILRRDESTVSNSFSRGAMGTDMASKDGQSQADKPENRKKSKNKKKKRRNWERQDERSRGYSPSRSGRMSEQSSSSRGRGFRGEGAGDRAKKVEGAGASSQASKDSDGRSSDGKSTTTQVYGWRREYYGPPRKMRYGSEWGVQRSRSQAYRDQPGKN